MVIIINSKWSKWFNKKTALLPLTGSSSMFARWRQCALCTQSSTPQSAAAPYRFCLLPSHFEYIDRIDRRTCLGMSWAGPFLPSKLSLDAPGSGPPHLTHASFIGPAQVHIPSGISIGSAVFGGLTIVTDRPTDSVCSDRPHLCGTAMRPNHTLAGYSARVLYKDYDKSLWGMGKSDLCHL